MPLQLYVNIAVAGVAFFTGIYCFKKLDTSLKFIVFFTGFAFFTEITLNVLNVRGVKNNLAGLHFYILVEFFIWMFFYRSQLHPFIRKRIITGITLLFEIYFIINAFVIQDLSGYPNIVRAVEGLILVVFSLLLFLKIMQEAKYPKLWKVPVIWINSAVLFYFSANFFYNILFNLILEYSRQTLRAVSDFFTFSNALFYLLIATGFFISKMKNTAKNS